MANRVRAYIQPYLSDGTRGDWLDVTNDVLLDSLGALATNLDNTEYDIGIYRSSNLTLKLRNQHGRYSEASSSDSIFLVRRSGALFKVTWSYTEDPPYAGVARVEDGYYMAPEVDIFVGIINDAPTKMSLSDLIVNFLVLGKESLFQRAIVPFGTISNGDLVSEVIYNCLNQDSITELLTIDQANIVPGLDQAIDSIASLQNQTVQESLNKLLLASNSVLVVEDAVVFVKPRTASVSVAYEFFGQGSVDGAENIAELNDISNGVSRVLNFITWRGTTLVSDEETSIDEYGAIKKEVEFEFFTDNTKRQNILAALTDEFSLPKQEFFILTRLNYDTLDLNLLDQVSVDFPLIALTQDPEVPLWDIAIEGVASTPKTLSSFFILPDDTYKLISRSVDFTNGMIKFRLRRI